MLGYLVFENEIDCAPAGRWQSARPVGVGVGVGVGVAVGSGGAVGVGVGAAGPPGFRHGHGSDSQTMFSSVLVCPLQPDFPLQPHVAAADR